MKNFGVPGSRARRTFLIDVIAAVLAVTYMFTLLQPVLADTVAPPAVPGNIVAPEGTKAFLVGHARGTQNYVCLPAGSGFAFKLFTPEATLFDDKGEQLITHFFSPNPTDGVVRATWLDSRDSSRVWALVQDGDSSTDANFVKPGAVAWLLLTAVKGLDGPTGGDRLSGTKAIQRVNTSGGLAPSTGCASAGDVGAQAFMPYTADYFFFR